MFYMAAGSASIIPEGITGIEELYAGVI